MVLKVSVVLKVLSVIVDIKVIAVVLRVEFFIMLIISISIL